jgi:hypothetical protein
LSWAKMLSTWLHFWSLTNLTCDDHPWRDVDVNKLITFQSRFPKKQRDKESRSSPHYQPGFLFFYSLRSQPIVGWIMAWFCIDWLIDWCRE